MATLGITFLSIAVIILVWWLNALQRAVDGYRDDTQRLKSMWSDAMKIAVRQQLAILHRIPDERYPSRREELAQAMQLLELLNREYPEPEGNPESGLAFIDFSKRN